MHYYVIFISCSISERVHYLTQTVAQSTLTGKGQFRAGFFPNAILVAGKTDKARRFSYAFTL